MLNYVGMNEYMPRTDKLPPEIDELVLKISETVAAARQQPTGKAHSLAAGPIHIENLPENGQVNDISSRFEDVNVFWEEGIKPPQTSSSKSNHEAGSTFGVSQGSSGNFLNNFWQYFFPDEVFERDDLLGPVVLSKPPRGRLQAVGGALLEPIQELFGALFNDANIDSHKVTSLEQAAGSHLDDLKEAMFMLYQLALLTVTQEDALRADCSSAHDYLCK